MKVRIISTEGLNKALFGLGLSYGHTSGLHFENFIHDNTLVTKMLTLATKLASKDGGHNSYLELINVWIDITAPRYWWQEMDRYRVGKSQCSESSMHTILKQELEQRDFEHTIPEELLEMLNIRIRNKDFEHIKNILPEGFLQRRMISINYKCLRNIIKQRHNHKLPQWKFFCETILATIPYPELLGEI